MQQSKAYKIFGAPKAGIDLSQTPQGRNVQPFSSIRKIETQQEKQIQAPFQGYYPVSDNNLAISQVSDLNVELTRKIIRQQLSKVNVADSSKTRDDLAVMKTEIRTIKEYINKKELTDKKDEFGGSIMNEVNALIEEHLEETKLKMREAIKALDESIKNQLKFKYLPFTFIEDVEKLMVDIEDKSDERFNQLEKKINGSNKSILTQEPVLVAETFDLRLKKTQREYEYLKKTVTEITGMLNEVREGNEGQKVKYSQESERIDKQIHKIQNQLQKESKSTQQKFVELNTRCEQISKKIQIIETNASKANTIVSHKQSSQSTEIKQFLSSSKGLAVSNVFENESKQPKQLDKYQQLFQTPARDSSPQRQMQNNLNIQKIQDFNVPLRYQIDKENYLLDEEGSYILNQNGKQIQLSEQQVDMLRKSNLVKLNQ